MPGFSAEVPCLDPLACNFMEEGECFFTDENGDPCVIEGCTIEGACNYNPEADIYDGSNVTGFSALPGGGRLGSGQYYSQGSGSYTDCSLWTSTPSIQGHDAWYRGLNTSTSGIWRGVTANGQWQQAGMSVRCLKDTE